MLSGLGQQFTRHRCKRANGKHKRAQWYGQSWGVEPDYGRAETLGLQPKSWRKDTHAHQRTRRLATHNDSLWRYAYLYSCTCIYLGARHYMRMRSPGWSPTSIASARARRKWRCYYTYTVNKKRSSLVELQRSDYEGICTFCCCPARNSTPDCYRFVYIV